MSSEPRIELDREIKNQSPKDLQLFDELGAYFDGGPDTTFQKIETFAKYVPRQTLAKFFTRYELFQRVLHVNGSIVECGVLRGGGVMAWAKLSSIFEPANHTRKIFGFDTFEGFPGVAEEDERGTSSHLRRGGLAVDAYDDILESVRLFDLNRPIGHIPKVELIRGDICETMPKFVDENPHLVVSLLYLDVDLYEPTKVAIESLRDHMPRGAIIVFDQLNAAIFPGETSAVRDALGLKNLRIERFTFDSYVSYAVLD